MENDRETRVAELTAALAALEDGDAPAPFLGGHGIQSRLFEFAWRDNALEIDFRLPWGLALDDEESRRERNAEIGAAIRLAILLIGRREGGGKTVVYADERGAGYSVFAADGSLEDAGDDWTPLVRRLEGAMESSRPACSGIKVIWP